MTSTEYKTQAVNVFDTACDEIGFDLALATVMAAVQERIERRGYREEEAISLMTDATLGGRVRTWPDPSPESVMEMAGQHYCQECDHCN